MQRLRLKADGRIVELRDGQEFPLAPAMPGPALRCPGPRCGATRNAVPKRRMRNRHAAGRARPAPPRAADADRIRGAARRARRDHPELGAGQARAARTGAGAARRDRPFAGNRFRRAGHGTGARLVRGLTRFLSRAGLQSAAGFRPKTLSVGTAVSAAHNGARSADTPDELRRGQWRKNPGDRAGHLGIARTHLRAASSSRRCGSAIATSTPRRCMRTSARSAKACAPRA